MDESNARPRLLRFGVFEVDLRTAELRKQGLKVKLHGQPFQVLAMLLERPGELVTREEIREKLWPGDTFVDFEHSVNNSIKRAREALGDDAAAPRFIETLPRHGYRFIAPVEGGAMQELPLPTTGPRAVRESLLRRHWAVAVASALVVALLAVLFALNIAGLRVRVLRAVGAVREPPLQIQSIAVLPFENLSHDPEQGYFADGMTEELITNLGKISALRVISRTSVMQYKGTKKPLPQIGRELNVDAVVEGTVQRSGDRVRITANLLHAPTDRHLWAESYERDLRDVLALQDEVARAITNEIQIKVTPQEHVRLGSARPVDPEAYKAYLKASTILDNWTAESGRSAIKYFEQALERDPGFAPASAGLADAYIFLGRFHYLPANETFPEAKQAARKALALDANSAEAYSSLCSVATFYDWDWRAAEMACSRAIELNPSYGPAHHMYSHYFISTGRFAESLRESLRYLELDPLSPAAKTHLGTHYKMARQYDLAIEVLRRTVELAPNFPDAYGELASSYIGKGAYQEAVPPARKAVMLTGGKGYLYLGLLGEAYGMAGRRSEATKVLEEIRGVSRGGFVPARTTVPVLIALGERDRAIEQLQRAFEEHDQLIPYLKVWCMFDPLRSDPRFQDLLRRMNFPP
ncbi:MAG: tetratricopeptide repeat protein [Terriglobia bacterium]|jgi:TolB-like protein/DNA-binding winged helix-turn-helix (wHTH) protein/Tfp pilus assembly protein PilF